MEPDLEHVTKVGQSEGIILELLVPWSANTTSLLTVICLRAV